MLFSTWLATWAQRSFGHRFSHNRLTRKNRIHSTRSCAVYVERLEDRTLLAAPTVANPIADQQFSGSGNFTFTFAADTFNDTDGDTLTYTARLSTTDPLPTWLTFDGPTRTFSGNPSAFDAATLQIEVTANDGNGGTVADIFELTVTNPNDAPNVANPIPDQVFTGTGTLSFTFAANAFADADGDTLSYNAEQQGVGGLPAWLTFNGATRTFSGNPSPNDTTPLQIEVTASDGQGGTISDVFMLTLSAVNDVLVVANPIPDQSFYIASVNTFTFAANTFSNGDAGATITYTAALSGGGALPSWLSFTSSTRTFSGSPGVADATPLNIVVTATDGLSPAVTDEFVLTLVVNATPVVTNPIVDVTFDGAGVKTFTFPANTFTDVNADQTLTYTATIVGGGSLPAWLTFDGPTRTFSGNPGVSDSTPVNIEVTANDGHNGTATDSFNIIITAPNDAPTAANSIPDQTFTGAGTPQNFTFAANTFTDADSTTLTYTAALVGGGALPTWLNFDGPSRTFSGTFSNSDTSPLQIRVTANDGNGGTVATDFQLTLVGTNEPPVLTTIGNKSIGEGNQLTFTVSATDANSGQTLVYSATGLPTGATFDANTHVFSWTPSEDQGPNTFNVTFTVSDGINTDSETINIAVTEVNQAPVVGGFQSTMTGVEGVTLSFLVTGTDADVPANALTFSATGLPAGATFDANTHIFSWTPTAAQINTNFSVTFSVNDGTATGTGSTTVKAITSVQVLRAYQASIGDHLYTQDSAEFANVLANGYVDESSSTGSFKLPQAFADGTLEVFRLFNPLSHDNGGGHYYTFNGAEKNELQSAGWTLEAMGARIYTKSFPGTVEIFRMYNPNTGKHLFTAGNGERLSLISSGWVQHSSLGFALLVTGTTAPATSAPVVAMATAADVVSDDNGNDSNIAGLVAATTPGNFVSDPSVTTSPLRPFSPTGSGMTPSEIDELWEAIAQTLDIDPFVEFLE